MGRRRAPLPAPLLDLSAGLREVARGQGGVVTEAQCRTSGVDEAVVRRLLAAGAWVRTRRGIYLDPSFPRPHADAAHHARCAALLASLARPAVVSHLSAARLLGLPLPPGRLDERVALTRRPPAATNDLLAGDVHVVDYDAADVVDLGGVPVLSGARLVLDCCEVLPPDSALAVADAALARGLTTSAALGAAVRARRNRPRVRLTELVVERADPLAESWFESVSRWWLQEAGLPRPRLQVPFADESGRVLARVDMLIGRVVGEADGAGKYDAPGALFAEERREDWLRDAHRLEVVRWVPAEMRSTGGRAAVAARFARATARSS
jgi:hypothetical protein